MGFIRATPPPYRCISPSRRRSSGQCERGGAESEHTGTRFARNNNTVLAHSLSISTAGAAKSVQASLTCSPTIFARESSATPGATRSALRIDLA